MGILSSLKIGGGGGCSSGCPSGEVCLGDQCVSCSWTRGSSCYNLVPASHTFHVDEGEDYCSSHFKGHLVAPSTEAEMSFLEQKLNEATDQDSDLRDTPRIWTGGVKGSGGWYWSNGESWGWEDMGSVSHGNYIYLSGNSNGEWKWHGNDAAHYPVLCETHY